ncbi:MAG: hypothetical protein FJ279_14485 [Planctomycetes bacterium]|nr:hypothetical protein [Planctomycetota bacterium]
MRAKLAVALAIAATIGVFCVISTSHLADRSPNGITKEATPLDSSGPGRVGVDQPPVEMRIRELLRTAEKPLGERKKAFSDLHDFAVSHSSEQIASIQPTGDGRYTVLVNVTTFLLPKAGGVAHHNQPSVEEWVYDPKGDLKFLRVRKPHGGVIFID